MNPVAIGCTARVEDRMSVSDLVAFGLVPHEVHTFRQVLRQGSEPLADPLVLPPLVAQAARAGLLSEAPQRWLVLSGTATGKSALSSLLLLHANHRGQHAVLLQSGRSQRRGTRAALADILSPEEARHSVTSMGRFLRRGIADRGSLRNLDLLVIDDLDRLLHPRRAGRLRRLLRLLQAHAPSVSIIALCDLRKSQAALRVLREPLRAQVLYGPEPTQVRIEQLSTAPAPRAPWPQPTHATSTTQADKPSAPRSPLGPKPTDVTLVDWLIDRLRHDEPTRVVVPQRSRLLHLLQRLLDACDLSPPRQDLAAPAPLAALQATSPGHAQALLRAALPHGIALDGPELTPRQRRLVRQAQARGTVRLTLGQVLPSRSHASTRVQNLVYVPSGSAATSSRRNASRNGSMNALPLGVLRSLSAGGRILIATHGGQDLSDGLRELCQGPLPAQPKRRPRSPGLTAFLRFLPPSAAGSRHELGVLEALTLVALTGTHPRLPLLLSERANSNYVDHLLVRIDERGLGERPLFRWLAAQAEALSHDDVRSIKAVLLLDDWLTGARSHELEPRYHIWAGQLVRCARSMAHRLRRLASRLRRADPAIHQQIPARGLIDISHRLRQVERDGVVEHRATLSRHIGILLGAVHALDAQAIPSLTRRYLI